jgi:hypothetical protein
MAANVLPTLAPGCPKPALHRLNWPIAEVSPLGVAVHFARQEQGGSEPTKAV